MRYVGERREMEQDMEKSLEDERHWQSWSHSVRDRLSDASIIEVLTRAA